jgi:hypothetical protein
MLSGMWRYVTGRNITDVSNNRTAFIFRVTLYKKNDKTRCTNTFQATARDIPNNYAKRIYHNHTGVS